MGRRVKPGRPELSLLLKVAILAAVYFASGRLGLGLDPVSGVATPVWPPTGLSLAALLTFGAGLWPGVALGALLTNAASGIPIGVAAGIAVGNTLEALAGFYLLRRVGFQSSLGRMRDVLAFVLLGVLVCTTLSATCGAVSARVGGLEGSFGSIWRVWWLGDMMGSLLCAPVLLSWSAAPRPRLPRRRLIEALALVTTLVSINLLVFQGWWQPTPLAYSYPLLPVLIWAALRFGQRGATFAAFITALIAIWGTATGQGPFAGESRVGSLLSLQMFMGVVATTLLILGAAIEEMEHAVRLRDDFLSVAGHEFKTPLTTLQLQLDRLRRLPRGAENTAERSAEIAQKAVDRLARMIEELLDVTRVRAGRLILTFEEVDLSATVKEVSGRFREEAARSGSVVEIDGPDTLTGRWDRNRVDQIVTNLLSNAIKYGSGKPVEVRVELLGARARLTVRDHGIGIAPEHHARIFQRFERAVSGAHFRGLGLGLWIVREIVDAHHGTISVESAIGAGTTFTVELPIRPPR